jgi:hypothetical protein
MLPTKKIKTLFQEFTIQESDLTLKHNHNPVRYNVKGCAYCMIKGNCLSNDDFIQFINTSEENIR